MLRGLPPIVDPNALVGATTADDAAVYRLGPELAAVATVDYITPVVDDPYVFGQIAVANAVSDVYAMGARPAFGLNVVNFPRDTLPLEVLSAILAGGADKAGEAGLAILGGHTIDDPEPKYGMAVFGTAHPDRIVTNAGARPGDVLVLTKPIGTGVITTAIKRDLASAEAAEAAVRGMATLNRHAAEVMLEVGVDSATDVTGFGLLGHLGEMVRGSGVGARVSWSEVPVLPGVWELVAADCVPGGTRRNLAATEGLVRWAADVSPGQRLVLCDAQTSGGLLMAVPAEKASRLLDALRTRDIAAARIGECTDEAGVIRVS